MKRTLFLIAAAALAYAVVQQGYLPLSVTAPTSGSDNSALHTAFAQRKRGYQLAGEGVVSRLLADDLRGAQHQRFILDVGNNLTLLIAHNIDLAPRIDRLAVGDRVAFYGEYEWNAKGGVVHWTHHDPNGRHVGGWLKHNGNIYQ